MRTSTIPRLARWALPVMAAAALLPALAQAQPAWPGKPLKLIVPFTPGGSNDNIARGLADKLGARLGQPIIVENKGGAGGTIGTDYVAKSAADGYTLLFASASIATNAAGGKKLPYDMVKDLEPIGEIGAAPFVIVAANEVKVTNLKDLIGMARAKPKSLSYGSAGIGGMNHLATELFASAAKVQLVHVPYKGIGQAFTDLMGGNLQMALPSLASVVPHMQAGRLRPLAITSAQRSPLAPSLPTASEAGLPGFKLEVWWGLLGPARMPPAVVKRLNAELNTVLAMPEMLDLLAREGATPLPGTPAEFRKLIASDLVRWGQLIKDSNIQME